MENKNDLFTKKVVAYVRVSTEEQKLRGLSIEAQTAALQEWADNNRVKILEFYNDAGFSARKPYHKRPAMVRLMEDVQAGKIDLIIFTKLDRWFRSLQDYFKVQEVLEKYHVDWKTIHEDYETTTSSGRLKINIMLSVAQDEADRTSERIKRVFEMKRQKLEPLTGNCPTGYKIEGKKIVKDPETEQAVRAFFDRFMSSGSIAAAQNHALEDFGLRISYRLADRMLRGVTYTGEFYGAKGMVPAYITQDEYERIQTMRRHPVRKTTENRVYLFSGIIMCGDCGCRLGGRTNLRSTHPFYNCSSHYLKRSDCRNNVNMNEKIIEDFLLSEIEAKMEGYRLEATRFSNEQRTRNYKAEISVLRSKLEKLKELFLNDFITMDEYKKDRAAIQEKIDELTEKEKPTEQQNFKKIEKVWNSSWRTDYGEISRDEKREFWRILIKVIRVYPDRHIEFDLNL